MGCIASKGICRSISIREEVVGHGFESSASAWEELMSSNGSKDQYFTLLSSSKIRSTSFKLPSIDVETKCDLSNNLSGLIPDFDGVAEGGHGGGELDLRRSKSCQLPRDNERSDRKQIGSRSFHTVEEYDALLERIHKLKDEYNSWEDAKLKGSNSVDENNDSPKNIRDGVKLDQELNSERENGWKRKAVGLGLKSLDVPSIEFPGVARFKQRGVGVEDQVSYVTPKFGSYNVGPTQEKEGGGESRVFSPELVAAFEDCMQQLQVEEDSILREIDGYSWVDDNEEEIENEVVKHGE